MYDGLPFSRLVSFSDGPPDGPVAWSLRKVDGTQIAAGNVTAPVGAVSVVLTIAANHNTRGPSDPLRVTRDLTWSYTVGGQARAGRERYFVEGDVPFPVSQDGVRNMLGAPAHNLPDQEIDLISAYWKLQAETGEGPLATAAGADTPAANVVARGIEAYAALEVLPTMPLRVALKESSATDSYTRFDIDWDKLEAALLQLVHAAVSTVSGEAAFLPGSIFQLTEPLDRFNPTG